MITRSAVALRYFPSMWRIKNWSNKEQINFTHKPNFKSKASKWRSCRKKLSRLLGRLISLKIDIVRTSNDPFCVFTLSTFQSNGNSHNLLHLRYIQKNVTANSHPDRTDSKMLFSRRSS